MAETNSPTPSVGDAAPSEEQVAMARELGASGIELYESGAYPEASKQLEEAYRFFKVPTTGLWSARALEKLGALTAAAERYREVLAMKEDSNEPKVFTDARRSAQQELDFLGPRIPTLVIRLHGATADEVVVTVDGVPIAPENLGVEFQVDPGTRRVVGTLGERAERVTLDMPERSKGSAVLDFSPAAPTAAPVKATPVQVQAQPDSRKTWGIVALSAGGAALVTGVVATILASGQRSALDQSCPGRRCTPEFHGQVDTLNATLTVSLVGYVAAAAGIGAGSYLLFTAESDAAARAEGPSVSLWLGAGSGGLSGRF